MTIAYSGTAGAAGAKIVISGSETIATLKTSLASNASWATVSNNEITFNATLSIDSTGAGGTATFTASNCVLIFPSTYTLNVPNATAQEATTLTFTDVDIIFDGSAKSYYNAINYGNLNWTRVVYRNAGPGRTDLFTNTQFVYNWNNVQLTMYGANDFCHTYSAGTVTFNGLTVTGLNTGESFEAGCATGYTAIYQGTVLSGSGITTVTVNNSSASFGGNIQFVSLNWAATNWFFDFGNYVQSSLYVINPNKPSGWTGYTIQTEGTTNTYGSFYEQYTHNITCVNTAGTGIVGASVGDYQSGAFVFTATTSTGGAAPTEYVTTAKAVLTSTVTTYSTTFTVAAWLYGYVTYTGSRTFTPAGSGILDTLLLPADVTTLSSSAVAALTSLATLDNLYDASRYWNTLNSANIQVPSLGTNVITYSGSQLNLGSYNLVVDSGTTTAGQAFAVSGSTITIYASALGLGTKFTSFTTTGSVTLNGGAVINAPYTCSSGSQGSITLTNLVSGSSIYVATSGGTQLAYVASNSGTTYTFYVPPNAGSNYVWNVAKYGYLFATGTFNPTVANTATVVQATDTNITQSNVSTVAAYTSITTLNQLYDYAAYFETTSAGINTPNSVSAAGGIVTITEAFVVNTAAGAVFSDSGSTVTINNCPALTAGTFSSLVTTGAVSGTSLPLQLQYTSSAGASLVVSLSNLVTGSSVAVLNGSGASQQYTASSGTSYNYYAGPGQTGNWSYRVAKYGYITASSSFTPSGTVAATLSQTVDTGITQATVATVQAYTSLATLSQLYDYAAYYQTTSSGILAANIVTKNGTAVSIAGSLVANSAGSTVFSLSGTTITIQGVSTLTAGSVYSSLTTTGTATGTTSYQLLYTTSAGTSIVLTLSNIVSGSQIVILNGSGASQQYTSSSGTSLSYYVAPGQSSATWTWRVAKYGYLTASGTFSVPGQSSATVVQTVDTNITQSNSATVAAYTSITVLDQLYDYAAYYQTTSSGILAANPVTGDGTAVELGAVGLTLASSGSVFTLTTSLLTVNSGAALGAGVNFLTLTTTAAVTAGTGTAADFQYTSSAGTSLALLLTNVLAGSSFLVTNGSGAQQTYVSSTGTTASYWAPPGQTGTWTWRVAKYGYLSASGTFSPVGTTSVAINQSTDTGITQSSASTVAGYTTLASPDQIYDYAAYYATTAAGMLLGPSLATKSGTACALGSTALVLSSSASSVWSYATPSGVPTVTVKAGTMVIGTTFASLTTSATLTTSGSALADFLYTSSAGTSGVIAFSNITSGARLYIYNGGTSVYNGIPGTSYTLYVPAAAAATYSYTVAYYGSLPATGTFSSSGQSSVVVTQGTDTGITQTNSATVAAYTTLNTLDNIYDYAAYYQTTAAGIVYSKVATKNGSQVTLGTNSLTVTTSGSSVWTYTSGALTIKVSSTLSSGTTFTSLLTSSTVTFSGSATNNCIYTSSAGTSAQLVLSGLVSGSVVYVMNASQVQQAYATGQTGTYTLNIAPGASSGNWTWATKALGYSHATGTFAPSAGGVFAAAPSCPQKVNSDGTLTYQGTTNSFVTVSFTGLTEAAVLIGNSQVTVQNVVDASENALLTTAGMFWLAGGLGELSEYNSFGGNFLFMTHNWRLKALNTSSPNATLLGFPVSTDGTPTDASNGTVTIDANSTAAQLAAAVWGATGGSYGAGTYGAELDAVLGIQALTAYIAVKP